MIREDVGLEGTYPAQIDQGDIPRLRRVRGETGSGAKGREILVENGGNGSEETVLVDPGSARGYNVTSRSCALNVLGSYLRVLSVPYLDTLT